MTALYFAYGSNLLSARLRGRVPSAEALGVALASGFALRLDKRGADGSGKANLHRDPASSVWGVVYTLDAGERDYARIALIVSLGDREVEVQTYRSDHLTPDPVAVAWYKQLLVDGAREHGLPAGWRAWLEGLAAR